MAYWPLVLEFGKKILDVIVLNYLMVDISGRVLNYDIALCEAIFKNLSKKDHLKLLAANIESSKIECPSKKMLSLIPKSLRYSENKIKRGIKALEGVVNYLYLVIYVLFHQVDVLHLQWLPFLEICSIERIFLKLIRVVSPKTKLILTVHNLYPHNFNNKQKESYRERFYKLKHLIDCFILHLECSKIKFCKQFNVNPQKVKVVHHGIFVPKNVEIVPHIRGEKLKLIMYGMQSYYKGTDIFIDALNLLPEESKQKVHAAIVGKIDNGFYQELKQKTTNLDVEWIPEFVPDEVLFKKIIESDIIVIPYREISQSGVLLLALPFKRMIIASDLPSFKETLAGFSDDMFFENGNAESLAGMIENCLNSSKKNDEYKMIIDKLCNLYSWNKIGKNYLHYVYLSGCYNA